MLETLADQTRRLSIVELSALTGLHGNTVREHLGALVASGLAQRHRASAEGRGRPAWLYGAAPAKGRDGREYAALATALAGQLARTSAHPAADALAAGSEWGRQLAEPVSADGPLDTRKQVVRILDELGFDPDPDGEWKNVKLRSCPLLDAARDQPDVVCGVHHGIVKGAIQSLGADPDGTELHAFHEPGACCLTLPAS